jgi:hypothetical protein
MLAQLYSVLTRASRTPQPNGPPAPQTTGDEFVTRQCLPVLKIKLSAWDANQSGYGGQAKAKTSPTKPHFDTHTMADTRTAFAWSSSSYIS